MVSIGKVVKSKGKRGELRLRLYSEHYLKPFFPRVYLHKKGSLEEFEVETLCPYKDSFLIKLKEIDTLDQAWELVGQEILVPEEFLRPLEENNYYLFQLIGSSVINTKKERVGMVKDILFVENNELLVVQKGKKEILIPFTKSICLEIDVDNKEILVNPPEGLLDLNEI
ncbi:MAG: 16S rRNA processing protein RimM [Candidatus Aminicenantes bacterium]|nr:16S rRNA processing protein RimM [Candidatus Aminicenantes bacterium]